MPKLLTFFLPALILTCCFTFSPSTLAAMSKSQAAAKAKAMHEGKVLSVNHIGSKNGKDTYKVKILHSNGRVKTITISG